MELLQQVLQRANISKWDILLVGDGSGSGWHDPCGWATTLIDRQTKMRKVFFGANNCGSINLAEMMPYLLALSWFHARHGKKRLRQQGVLRVHVITDSQVTALHGTRVAQQHELPTVGHRALWAAMQEFGRRGYQIEYHWAPRSESLLNWASDLLAGLARREVKHLNNLVNRGDGFDGCLAARAAGVVGRIEFADPADGAPIDINLINHDEEGKTDDPSPIDSNSPGTGDQLDQPDPALPAA